MHGERLADPYRWLEDDGSDRVREWTDAQNARTRTVLDAIPQRAHFARRIGELLSVGLLETPRPIAGKIFHVRRAGAQKQHALYVRDAEGATDAVAVDPNAIDPMGLVTLDWWYPSWDGRYVAYGLSRGGDEMSTLQVRDLASGRDLEERIPDTQRCTVAWVDGGFYYTVHPAKGSVAPGDENYHRRVRFHRLGEPRDRDALVFGEGRPKEDILGVATSPDGRWALLAAWHGWRRNDLYLLDRGTGELRTVQEGVDGISTGIPLDDALWLRTNVGSPSYRVVRVAYERLAPDEWRTVVPECEHVVDAFDLTRDRIAVLTLEKATSRISIWTKDGVKERDLALPGLGTVPTVQADPRGDAVAYAYQSFTEPAAAYLADARAGTTRELVRLPAPHGLDRAGIVVEQTVYASTDGTPITMFLIHRRDSRPDGHVPTVLTGYGGFNISRTPLYSAGVAAWAEAGGLVAIPNLRGGGEYGERWHRAGMLANKQNVFDDFLSAAEALIRDGWTAPARLAISGGSNGGLLVGAALTQRPDLFAAVVCAVPLLDMLRYQRFRIARLWIAEYGSTEDAEQFRWLRAYSPYHNVRAGIRYPAVLFTTAEGDSRVDPMHARKMAALLQAQTEDPNAVVLLRVDRDAGHGIGKPLDKQVDDFADQYAFLAWRTGLASTEKAMLGTK